MDNPLIYILLNGSLNMSPGKAAAQAAHAMASLQRDHGISEFTDETKRTVIVLEAQDQQQMDNLFLYLEAMDIPVADYTDEGVNEITPYSLTAMAAGPIRTHELDKRDIFKPFPLFPAAKPKKRWYQK